MPKKICIIFSLLLLSVGCNQATKALPSPAPQYNYTHRLKVGQQNLLVEIASTSAQMEQGLSGRVAMDKNQGMLFDFSAGGNVATPAFWMKEMKFDLDFIWITNGKIIGITPGISRPNSPADPLPTYNPPMPVNQVLEVNSGWAEKNSVQVGDEVYLKN